MYFAIKNQITGNLLRDVVDNQPMIFGTLNNAQAYIKCIITNNRKNYKAIEIDINTLKEK